jgi:SAM-dependent methyltransferase
MAWRTSQAPWVDFSAAEVELAETLDSLDGAENYAAWIFGLIEPHLGHEVLEVGAGHGTFTEILARRSRRVVAIDLSERCVDVLRARFSQDLHLEVLHGGIDTQDVRGPFDAVVLINVLEHIEDDDGALDNVFNVLKPGGRLILWVPAFEFLYSDFDRKIGHYRRYRQAALRTQLERAGYTIADIRYVNAVGAIAWLVVARLLRRTPTTGTPVKLFDRYFVPILRRIEQRCRAPIGQSIFAVGVRPAEQMDRSPDRGAQAV